MGYVEALKEIAGHDIERKGTSGDDAIRFIYLAREALKGEEKDWPALVRKLKYAIDARQIAGAGYDPVWGEFGPTRSHAFGLGASFRSLARFRSAYRMNATTRAIVTAGLADVLHVVEDAPYLASIVQAAQKECEAQLLAGRALLECVRITARHYAELRVLADLGERVFGEDG